MKSLLVAFTAFAALAAALCRPDVMKNENDFDKTYTYLLRFHPTNKDVVNAFLNRRGFGSLDSFSHYGGAGGKIDNMTLENVPRAKALELFHQTDIVSILEHHYRLMCLFF
jgi:hypothetical protein